MKAATARVDFKLTLQYSPRRRYAMPAFANRLANPTRLSALLLLVHALHAGRAEEPDSAAKWEAEIQKFEAADKEHPPEEGGVLFVGSSSIRLWDVENSFPELKPLNRGFGGSQYSDVVHYAERIVVTYKPRVIVLYSGDNDIAGGKTADEVVADVAKLLAVVEKQLPEAHVVILPIKPSVARWKLWTTMQKANAGMKKLAGARDKWHYADTATPVLGDDGQPRRELFVEDGLHLNDKGYELWSRIVQEAIDEMPHN
jgi:lysophospholipase L1-like esterase